MKLKLLVFVGIVGFLSMGWSSCVKKPKEKFIGLQLWSVKDDMKKDVPATLAAVGEMGYKFVEAAEYGEGKIYGMEPTEFKNLCEKNGLKFLGAHTGQDVPTAETWDNTMAWWDVCIAAHKKAGAKWIVQPWMGIEGYNSLDGLKRYCEYFNAVGEKCNAAGIRFGYHNHDKEYTTVIDGKTVYDWMLELTQPEKVMFELDLYWIVIGGKNPLDYFEKYPGRFELFHIKDHEEVGASGKIDFEAIFAERENAGAKYGIVEVERYNFEPLESVKQSIEFIKTADYIDLY
jgi:sugar phosphate isomerase/epimerase